MMPKHMTYLEGFMLGLCLAVGAAACGDGTGRLVRTDGSVDQGGSPTPGPMDGGVDVGVAPGADGGAESGGMDGGLDGGADTKLGNAPDGAGGSGGGIDAALDSRADTSDAAGVSIGMDGGGADKPIVDAAGPAEQDADFACPSVDGGAVVLPSAPDHVVPYPNVTVSTFAGGADDSAMSNPVGVAIMQGGELAISDIDDNLLRRVSSTGAVSILTQQSSFRYPFALAYDGTNQILYATTDANAQGGKDSSPRTTSTLWAVNPGSGAASNIPVATGIGYLRGVGVLSDGRVVAADRTNHLIWLIDPTAGTKKALAGSAACTGGTNGSGIGATFTDPYGLTVLPDDSVVVADYALRVLRKVTVAGVVTTFAGDGGPAGTIDGPALSARFDRPQAVAADAQGVVYVSDTGAHRIRRIGLDGMVTTLAGSGTQGFADGAGDVAQFFAGEGLAAAADGGTVYVADGTFGSDTLIPYHRIRKITIGP
jgi:hypothetical protein